MARKETYFSCDHIIKLPSSLHLFLSCLSSHSDEGSDSSESDGPPVEVLVRREEKKVNVSWKLMYCIVHSSSWRDRDRDRDRGK